MKNKKIRNIIILFLLMIVVLVGGFFLIQSEIENGKISVVVATCDIDEDYKITKADESNGLFTIEKRDAEHVGEYYYTSVSDLVNDCLANRYIVDSGILKGQVISKNHFEKEQINVSTGPVGNLYDGLFDDPVFFTFTAPNLTDVDNFLGSNKEIKIYSLNNNWLTVLFEKVWVRRVEYSEAKVSALHVVIEREDYLKALTVDEGSYRLFVFEKDVTEKNLSEIMTSINQDYGSPSGGFEIISKDFLKVNNNLAAGETSKTAKITFFEDKATFVWRGTDLTNIYIEHYNLNDGSRGIYYGRYPADMFRYESKTDEYSLTPLDEEGYYEMTVSVSEKVQTGTDSKGNPTYTINTKTFKYCFIIEKEQYDFKYINNDLTLILTSERNEYYEGGEPTYYFVKDYFKNIEKLQDKYLTLEQLQFNYGSINKKLILGNQQIELECSSFLDYDPTVIGINSSKGTVKAVLDQFYLMRNKVYEVNEEFKEYDLKTLDFVEGNSVVRKTYFYGYLILTETYKTTTGGSEVLLSSVESEAGVIYSACKVAKEEQVLELLNFLERKIKFDFTTEEILSGELYIGEYSYSKNKVLCNVYAALYVNQVFGIELETQETSVIGKFFENYQLTDEEVASGTFDYDYDFGLSKVTFLIEDSANSFEGSIKYKTIDIYVHILIASEW